MNRLCSNAAYRPAATLNRNAVLRDPALIDRESDLLLAHGRVAQAERLSILANELREVAP